ncbi:glucokinase [Acidipila rosea]|uniref:Glucokinase n=1 Tax=Acidipila rosea TaxID=768535 RepID=A0A4R1LCJ2_9BACT|nr:glucokinase [Acidipila rosea]MBW4027235.1 glucokinase [Acidobacteriota bacterium]MBW4046177.1 glucokinase [Acidobacteriota bacterium]TCK74259.1 glucokinase [Acidipila rosea]
MILAGDVGGTKVHLALYSFEKGSLTHVRDERFPAQAYAGLEVVVRRFLAESGQPEITAACFGVPGPVRNGRLKLTNLPWELDSAELSRNLGIQHLFLINDLEANGYGIPELNASQIFVLSEGDAGAIGHRGLVSAGTGLGEAVIVWNGKVHQPMASEGGHCDFAPRNETEIELFRYLHRTLNGRVSYERVVSGIGLKNIYSFLRDEKKMDEPAWLRERMQQEDPNAVIGEVGEDGSNELCAQTLDIFASAYGAEAGNLALKILAVGGLYLGGGIAPKILKKMQDGAFMKAFTDKGRLSNLLVHTPVRIILESRCALMGAAAFAEARAAEVSGQSVRAASAQQA